MKKVVFVFPGQGSQVVGMAADFLQEAGCREMALAAEEVLKVNLIKMMRDGPLEDLTRTEHAQPALLVAGMMAFKYLNSIVNKPLAEMAWAVAGHSLGEYTAVCAGGGLTFEKAVELVGLRGRMMARAPKGGMAAVLGMPIEKIEEILQKRAVVAANGGAGAATEGAGSLLAAPFEPQAWVANDNADGQVIVSGTEEGLAVAEEALKAAGAKRVLRLNVGGAFHTPLMTEAAGAVNDWIKEHGIGNMEVPCVMNHDALSHSLGEELGAGLVAQIVGRVRWRETLAGFRGQGTGDSGQGVGEAVQVVELGVGKVLSGMANRVEGLVGVSLETRAAVEDWVKAQG